jgi:calcineurin-like phosphoesterase family protein
MTTNTYFTSDTHWTHHNIRKFCPETRPCSSTEEMDEMLITQWNKKVPRTGTVYHLGDFTFSEDHDYVASIISRLHGKIHLILGNHDKIIRFTPSLREMFASVQDYKQIHVNKRAIMLCHYPLRSWDKAHGGAYHLFGHCHGSLDDRPFGKSMDVGIDTRPGGDMMPWSFEEIEAIMVTRPFLDYRGRVTEAPPGGGESM